MAGDWYVWDGSIQRPARFDGIWNGAAVQPVYEPNPDYPTGSRLARLQPFSSDSAFNTAMGSGATFETSWVTMTDPSTSAVVGQAWIPTSATPTGGTDKHVAIIWPDGRTVQEMYSFTRVSDTSVTSGFTLRNDMHGTGLTAGTRASGTSILGGLIRSTDLANGVIPHTLSMGIANTNLQAGFVWPARSQDSDAGTAYTGTIPMGTMFAIPPSVNLNSLGLTTTAGMWLATCLQDYGAHIMIRSSDVTLYAELACSDTLISNMRVDFPTIRDQLRRVTNNTAGNISGGGTRRQPTAAALYNPMYGTPMIPA